MDRKDRKQVSAPILLSLILSYCSCKIRVLINSAMRRGSLSHNNITLLLWILFLLQEEVAVLPESKVRELLCPAAARDPPILQSSRGWTVKTSFWKSTRPHNDASAISSERCQHTDMRCCRRNPLQSMSPSWLSPLKYKQNECKNMLLNFSKLIST